jgi:antitoxin component YwqK of YwqJK toxin-antitoxin module
MWVEMRIIERRYDTGELMGRHYINEDDKLHGQCDQWFKSGRLWWSGKYENDEPVGKWTYWFEISGQRRLEEWYNNDGDLLYWKRYQSNGDVWFYDWNGNEMLIGCK